MRYLNLVLLVVGAGSAMAFGCGDSDSISASAGGGGSSGEGGTSTPQGGKGGTKGSAGQGGVTSAGAGGKLVAGGSGGASTGGGTGGGGTGAEAGATVGGGSGAPGEGGAGGEAQTTTSLTVTIAGAPDGQTISVAVSGPNGFSRNVSATTTFNDVEPGSYTVVAAPLSIPITGPQVNSILDAVVTGSGTVGRGTAANLTVTYTKRAGTGTLWVTNDGSRTELGFNAAQLAATGAQVDAASVALTVPNIGTGSASVDALAFSSTGDMWVGYCRITQVPQVLAKISAPKLGTASPTADVVLTLPSTDSSYDCVEGLAFDSSGNLWAAMYHGHLLRYDAADLATTGTPSPSVILTSTAFKALQDILFDANGNLYVAPYIGGLLLRLDASQLSTSNAALTPAVSITLPAGGGASGLALDTTGNLWVSDYNHDSVIKYDSGDLGASGTPTPVLTVTTVPGPQQLAFDNASNLWVAAFNNSTVVAFAAAELATGGAKTPLTTLSGNGILNGSFGLRFNSTH